MGIEGGGRGWRGSTQCPPALLFSGRASYFVSALSSPPFQPHPLTLFGSCAVGQEREAAARADAKALAQKTLAAKAAEKGKKGKGGGKKAFVPKAKVRSGRAKKKKKKKTGGGRGKSRLAFRKI